ncbi:MAG TPA: hypothetical protein VD704_14280 [Gaiellaceae bacterium]|nr:hypothetical protein [Gaiellaceae bacterium]
MTSNARLPKMAETPPKPRSIKGRVVLMAEQPKADAGRTKRMAPVVKARAARAPSRRPDMEEPPAAKGRAAARTAKAPRGYVRLRLRVRDGELEVVGAKAVEGPLVQSKLQGELAYEVTVGDKRVSAGAIPDAGERRSFPDPKAKDPEMQTHHVTQLRTYEVNVRVPKEEVSASALPKLEVALYRVKQELPPEGAAAAVAGPIGPRFQQQLREVGRMKGIRTEKLSDPLAKELKEAFKR